MGLLFRNAFLALLILAGSVVNAQLNGIYSIDPSKPASGRNFTTFKTAIQALERSGVSSHVVFNVASTTFQESLVINQIPNVSLGATITFTASGAPAVLIASAAAPAYGIHLKPRVSWIRFFNLKIQGYLMAGIFLDNDQGKDIGPSYNEFTGLEVDNGSTFWPNIRAVLGDRANFNRFRDCIFRASGQVVDIEGNENLFERCEIDGKGKAANLTYFRAIHSPKHNVVQNCFLHGCGASSTCHGVIADDAVMYFHNTIIVKTDGPCVAAGVTPSNQWPLAAVLRNNILVNLGIGPVLRFGPDKGFLPACDSDYNCVFAPNSFRPVQVGLDTAPEYAGSLAGFLAWQQANSSRILKGGATSYDSHSLQTDPGLVSTSAPFDIHLKPGAPVIDRGTTSLVPAYIPFSPWRVGADFESQVRISPVDIGADEVSSSLLITGSGKTGTLMVLSLSAQHNGGLLYQVGSSLGTGPIPIGGRKIGLSPDGLFMASVSGSLPAIFQSYIGFLDGSGRATARIQIPKMSSIKGLIIFSAFITMQMGAPMQIQTISQTCFFRII